MPGGEASRPAGVLQAALAHSGMRRDQIHAEHVSVGGPIIAARLWEILEGDGHPTQREYDSIAVALNNSFVDQGLGHAVPYYDELDGDREASP